MTSSKSDPIWDLATVQIQVSEAADLYGRLSGRQHHAMLQAMGPHRKHESPLEAVFWIWWITLEALMTDKDFGFALEPQHEVECEGVRYRLDFAVPEYKVAIELDGHEFHERTKEQVAYRNQRDRLLQAAGWSVFHYSGSELYRNQVNCVSSVIAFVRQRRDEAGK
jgi:very-short-patch-repair endonuclease